MPVCYQQILDDAVWNIFAAVRVAEIIAHGVCAIILVYDVTSGD